MATVINIMDIVDGTSTNSDGLVLYHAIKTELRNGGTVIISLKGCIHLSSSFLNSSIGELYTELGYEDLKKSVFLRDYTSSQANTFIKYIADLKELTH